MREKRLYDVRGDNQIEDCDENITEEKLNTLESAYGFNMR